MKKKVIFVGGTARSGSTLLDLILSNDDKILSLGEIIALFEPTRKHHFEEIERLKNIDPWKLILKGGKSKLYENLINFFPEYDAFVDSSKNSFWINYHISKNKSILTAKNVLIYKSPEELANSFIKRGQKTEWIKAYESYHRKYFYLVDNFVTISYKNLTEDNDSLKDLCEYLGIDFFEGKKNYWEKNHNTFFGSNSVKSKNSLDSKRQLSSQSRKDIKYDSLDPSYSQFVNRILNKKENLREIEKILNSIETDFGKKVECKKIGYGTFQIFALNLKNKVVKNYYSHFPENIFE